MHGIEDVVNASLAVRRDEAVVFKFTQVGGLVLSHSHTYRYKKYIAPHCGKVPPKWNLTEVKGTAVTTLGH